MKLTIVTRRIAVGVLLIALAMGLGALVSPGTNAVDNAWMQAMLSIRNSVLTPIALMFDYLGGGWRATFVIPILIALLLVLFRRPWSSLAFVIASAGGAGLVQLLKSLYDRARPEEMMVTSDHGSFPSGHTANAAVIAAVLILVLRTRSAWIAGIAWVVAMACSRTYLGAHWLSDTVAGAMLGTAAALIVVGCFTSLIVKEKPGFAFARAVGDSRNDAR